MQMILPRLRKPPALGSDRNVTSARRPEPDLDAPTPHHRSRVVLLWTAFVFCVSFVEWARLHDAAPHPAALWAYVVTALVWPISPVIFLLVVRMSTARVPVAVTPWGEFFATHAAFLACLMTLDVAQLRALAALLPLPIPEVSLQQSFVMDVVGYVIMATAFELGRYSMQYRLLELARARLGVQVAEARRRRAEAELRALKAELNPHFLGNALASVIDLLRTDAHAAERTLAQIGELVGRLGRRGAHEVTLDEELEGLAPVLEYERLRLSGRLDVVVELASGARDALVPDMILHPLVENAVKYGLAPQGGGTLRISADRTGTDGGTLVLCVRDTVAGIEARETGETKHGSGLGLSNVRARLTELHGTAATLVLEADGPHSTVARVTMPWRDETSGPSEPVETVEPSVAPSTPALRDRLVAVLRSFGASALRVGALVGVWIALARWLVTVALNAPVPPQVHPDVPGRIIDAMSAGTLYTVMIAVAVMMSLKLSRDVSAPPALPTHLLMGLAFGIAGTLEKVVMITIRDPLRWSWMPTSHFVRHAVQETVVDLVWYLAAAGIASAALAVWHTRWSRAGRLRLHQQLEEERHRRAAAELRALQSELNPHFVGNALGIVSSLVHTDRAAATRVLEELGVLLRAALSRAATHEVTLRDELVTLRSFLQVEHARLGRRVDVHWRVDDAALDGRVPHMILQPLVENAVKHGLAPHRDAGRIEIEARRGDRELELVVRDDGVGMSGAEAPSDRSGRRGVGLANTRARLSELYGPVGRLDLSHGENGGTVARVRIPWHLDSINNLDLVAGGRGDGPTLPALDLTP